MIGVVKAFDRTPLAELPGDDAAALETMLATAARLFADRGARLNPFQRIEILRKLAVFMEGKRVHLGRQIAAKGGKPVADALVETDRAIN